MGLETDFLSQGLVNCYLVERNTLIDGDERFGEIVRHNNVCNLDPAFFEACLDVSKQTRKAGIQSPLSPTTTQVAPTPAKFGKPDAKSARSRLTAHYPDAFTDFHGTPSGAPCIYKTGPAWPKRQGGPHAQPYIREMRPVHGHPITTVWRGFLKDVQAYLDAELGAAKKAADYVKGTILSQAGFPAIDVAVREWVTTLSGRGPKLPSLDPLVDSVAEFRHPFTSTLGLSIASAKAPYYEGTVALYLRCGNDNDDIIAITAAHVAHPPPLHRKTGISAPNGTRYREEIIALGSKAYNDAITDIMSRIGTLHEINDSLQSKIRRLGEVTPEGEGDAEAVAESLLKTERQVEDTKSNINHLDHIHSEVTKLTSTPQQRSVGFVLYASPVGPADGPNGCTLDWAAIQLSRDAFDWAKFKGNKVYIGGNIKEEEYGNLMFPNHKDRASYRYPPDGLLQVLDVVLKSEIQQPNQRNAHGDNAMPVIKNGLTTGTTVGWVNGLESLVRYYPDYDLEFTAFETTILSYGGRGAFSDQGDSGALILDRGGRIVAMLTGGGGSTDESDVTFGTAWYELESHIRKALPGCFLYPVVSGR
ncbi:hypothetical protein C7212DRAFT_354227 [Tuber magnatum]|uniref:Uncharacterized protein n=1 Tax=Tuber magnatum TaxID=42249 RepID=A0A317SHU0_9PEZI|nr:hypothetical protein C7212DRAFT_354227 [Tuber magnatum]